jgi:excisionase family DNA binding protein
MTKNNLCGKGVIGEMAQSKYDIKIIEVLKRYDISRSTLHRRINANQIPHLKIGKNIRFNEQELEKWEKENALTANDIKRTPDTL